MYVNIIIKLFTIYNISYIIIIIIFVCFFGVASTACTL